MIKASRSHYCVYCEHKKEENSPDDRGYISDLGSLAHTLIPLRCDMPALSFEECAGISRHVPGFVACARFLWHVPGVFGLCRNLKKLSRDLRNTSQFHNFVYTLFNSPSLCGHFLYIPCIHFDFVYGSLTKSIIYRIRALVKCLL